MSICDYFFQIMIHEGLYSVFLEDWFRIFPRKQIYVVRMEDYSPNIPGELAKIYQFLQLSELTSIHAPALLLLLLLLIAFI